MADDSPQRADLPHMLTTSEVADLLRVKERKVYDMAAAGEIPHRRVTGKLLFPATEVSAWLSRDSSPRPAVLGGSHDPLLEWAVRESECGLSMLLDGSLDGLRRFQLGELALAGMHIPEDAGWNEATIAASEIEQAVLIAWAKRQQGLIVGRDVAELPGSLTDLDGLRLALRQQGAGSRVLFDRLAVECGFEPSSAGLVVRTESEAASAVASGEADVALGLEAAAGVFGLRFVPLVVEQFDLLIDRRAYFTQPIQTLLRFCQNASLPEKAARLGGYDIDRLGEVRWLSR